MKYNKNISCFTASGQILTKTLQYIFALISEKNIDTSGEKIHEKQTVDRRTYLKLAGAAGSGLGAGVGTGALDTEFTEPVRAASTVVDDFTYSSGVLSDRYVIDPDAGNATVVEASTVGSSDDDSNVLEIKDDTSVLHAYQGDDKTDLNAYPEIGDTFSCWIRELNGTGTMNFIYGAKDASNKYYVQLNLTNAHLGLFKYVNGSGDSLAGDWNNSTIENNTGWFKVEIEWTTDHQHTVTLYQDGSQVTSFSTTDDSSDPFTANGVGFAGHLDTTGETAQFDYATTTGSSSEQAPPPTEKNYAIIDGFEDGDLSEYNHNPAYNGSANVASSSNAPVYEGSNILEISGENAELISKDGLNTYPVAGDRFSYWFRITGGAINGVANVTYGVQGYDNRYYIQLDFQDDYLRFAKYQNGSADWFEHTSATYQEDVWYELEVTWDKNGDQAAVLYDEHRNRVADVFGNDSTWTSGGIGYDGYLASSGGSVYFDYVTKDDLHINGDEVKTATRYDKKEKQYSVTENNFYRLESTIHCIGGYPTKTAFETTYRLFSYGVARRYNVDTETPEQGDNIKVIDEHEITVQDDTSDSVNGELEFSPDHSRVGGWPTPKYTALEMTEDGLEEVAKVAMSSLHDAVATLIDFGQVYQKWSQQKRDNRSNLDGENRTFNWYYGDGWTSDEHSDVGNFIEFDFQQPLDTETNFFAENQMWDGSVNPSLNWKVHVQAPTSSSTSSTSSTSMSGRELVNSMSAKEKAEWGLRKVPIKHVEARGIKVSDPIVVDDDKMWFATSPKVKFTTSSSDNR